MPRFFISKNDMSDSIINIRGEDYNHITKTLRMKCGEKIEMCDTLGWDYFGKITEIGNESVTIQCHEIKKSESEPSIDVDVYVAMPKGDKIEFITQKAVELGAGKIVFFMSSRCVSRPDDKACAKKVERLQKIASEAAKQSERGIIPEVCGVLTYAQMLERTSRYDNRIFFYERGGTSLESILNEKNYSNICIITGPEGGFSDDEVQSALDCGLSVASLGKRILRCETAPVCALSAIMYHSGNL